MTRPTTAERLARAKEARDQAEAKFKAASAAMLQENRRKDTRRKIVLGAAVMTKLAQEPKGWRRAWDQLMATLSERDRKLFEGWTPPAPSASQAVTPLPEKVEQSSSQV